MLSNYIKTTLRNILRYRFYTLINITGLTAGFSACILIFIYLQNELSYDRYHENADSIYRVTMKTTLSSSYQVHFARNAYGYVLNLPEDFPEIKKLARFQQARHAVTYGDRKFYEDRFFFTDNDAFELFSWKFIKGDPATALAEPNTIVITEEMAEKYFGEEDPIGKTLGIIPRLQTTNEKQMYRVTAVLENTPANSHFHFDFLAYHIIPRDPSVDNWNYVYVLLEEGASVESINERIPEFMTNRWPVYNPNFHEIPFQKLTDIHLHSNIDREIENNSNIIYVYVLAVTAILILIIASINYMNLSTAKSALRSKEVGIRKVMGAYRKDLTVYFLLESLILSLSAFSLSAVFIKVMLPFFNRMVSKELAFNLLDNIEVFALFLAGVILTGLISGLYPALFLSSYKPVDAIKSSISASNRSKGESKLFFSSLFIRKVMVIMQFAVSIILIIFTLIVNSQLQFMNGKDLGFSQENTIAIPYLPRYVNNRFDTFKEQLTGKPGIISVSAQMESPGREILDAGNIFAEGKADNTNPIYLYVSPVADNYVEFMDIDIISGRDFTPGTIVDNQPEYILNESALKVVGWDSPEEALNKQFAWRGMPQGEVVGVIKDINTATLKQAIKPIVYFVRPIWFGCFMIKIESDNINSTLNLMSTEWETIFPNYPFEYYFVDDLYRGLYNSDETFASVISSFSILAIVIACLGLLGLSAITTVQRTREIGIRKVLGSSPLGIVQLISKDFLKWIITANIIALPTAYYTSVFWLQDFAYRIDPGIGYYLFTGFLTLLIALATISYLTFKAASINPIDTLRYE
ncbi:MAG: FtsX-like permease family protein [bacterium]|nr:FtsX-like permease family protein [bacterium]